MASKTVDDAVDDEDDGPSSSNDLRYSFRKAQHKGVSIGAAISSSAGEVGAQIPAHATSVSLGSALNQP